MANAVLSGHNLDAAWSEWTTHRRDIMEANYKLWPAAQVCPDLYLFSHLSIHTQFIANSPTLGISCPPECHTEEGEI